jgi:hypothetical protein
LNWKHEILIFCFWCLTEKRNLKNEKMFIFFLVEPTRCSVSNFYFNFFLSLFSREAINFVGTRNTYSLSRNRSSYSISNLFSLCVSNVNGKNGWLWLLKVQAPSSSYHEIGVYGEMSKCKKNLAHFFKGNNFHHTLFMSDLSHSKSLHGIALNTTERKDLRLLTNKNTPPTSCTRIAIECFTECLHQIFTVNRTHGHRVMMNCGSRTATAARIMRLRHGRRRRRTRWCCSTCCWRSSFGHVKGHSHFWLIREHDKFTKSSPTNWGCECQVIKTLKHL